MKNQIKKELASAIKLAVELAVDEWDLTARQKLKLVASWWEFDDCDSGHYGDLFGGGPPRVGTDDIDLVHFLAWAVRNRRELGEMLDQDIYDR